MGKPRVKPNYRRQLLRLPDLDHCERAVLNSLGSPASRRVYEYAIDQFIAWYKWLWCRHIGTVPNDSAPSLPQKTVQVVAS